MSGFYPVSLRADGLRCVVIGGGSVARRKVLGLLDSGARPRVIAPVIHPSLLDLGQRGVIDIELRPASDTDVLNADLVFLTTDDSALNAVLDSAARAAGAMVNRADDPQAGTFHVPAVLRRGDITITISTSGRSPAFAALIRDELEPVLTDERLFTLDVLAEARERLKQSGHTPLKTFWQDALDARASELVREGRRDDAISYIVTNLEGAGARTSAAVS